MELQRGDTDLEQLNQQLNDPELLKAYKEPLDGYKVATVPRFLGKILVWCGNLVYGKKPTYLKFRAVEVIARVPYHSWSSASYTLLTLFYTNEKKAMQLAKVAKYATVAQENETMHVVVISQLCKDERRAGFVRYTLIPMLFAFFYFWASYILYLVNPRYSYQLNYMFENHAFEQYDEFLQMHSEELKHKPVRCTFLDWYGRYPKNQFELFLSIRNDEIIHRNTSVREIDFVIPNK
ncbi:MAG TPA: alternative oxidase [Candidatus Paceibacterota bacterium]